MEHRDAAESGRGRRSKVARLIETYSLSEIGADLEREWTKEGTDRRSLRDLARDFNTAILNRSLSEAGVQAIDVEVQNLYEALTGAETTSVDRTRVRRRLDRQGIDVDQLLEDFVSYQAIRTYLKDYRGATYEARASDPVEQVQSNVQQLRSRLVTVAENRVERLADTDRIGIHAPGVLVDMSVICEECGAQFDMADLGVDVHCDCP